MGSLNKVMVIGRLGRDPEVRYTQSGQAVANFSLATDERWTTKSGEKTEKTEWHRIVAWARQAEIVGQYLKKGRQVYVEGRLQTREYEDKEGVKRRTTEIVATDLQFLDRGDSAGAPASGGGGYQSSGGGGGSYQGSGGSGGSGGGGQSPSYGGGEEAPMDDVPF